MSDAEILEQYYRDKNQEWIGILLERYTLLLFGVCMKYLKNEDDAKDCVQQIFLKVLTEAPKYRIEYFKSWLYMVAKNHCLMKLRGKGAKNVRELNEDAIPHTDLEKTELLQNEETYELLEEALQDLNEEQRQCVILFYLKKKSYQQVAEKTGYTLLQVKSFIQNGKRNLRIMLEKRLEQKKRQQK
jgi:RNA polymerase sigma-70 factor (ECF subfamily)